MTTSQSLLDLLSHLRAQRKSAEEELARIDTDLKSVERTLALLQSRAPAVEEPKPTALADEEPAPAPSPAPVPAPAQATPDS